MCYKAHMEVRAQISGVNSLLLPCPRDQILFISYDGKYLYPLSPKLYLFHADLEAFQQAKLTTCQPAWRMLQQDFVSWDILKLINMCKLPFQQQEYAEHTPQGSRCGRLLCPSPEHSPRDRETSSKLPPPVKHKGTSERRANFARRPERVIKIKNSSQQKAQLEEERRRRN